MQQAVEVAQGRNDEMAEATKTAECQNGLPGESGGNLGPRRPNKCMECNCLASLWSTAGVGPFNPIWPSGKKLPHYTYMYLTAA